MIRLRSAFSCLHISGFDLAFVLLCGIAFIYGIHTTGDLHWPYDVDQDRDAGMAQSILDGHYGEDHVYRGETIWYNPLVSIVVAVLSHLTKLPPPQIVTQAGAYLNLLGPVAFYIMVATLFDRWIALSAAAAFLFAPIGGIPAWGAASYSPWLFGPNFAQAFFYFSVAAYYRALQTKNWRWYFLAGIILGVTFLGHTAPAVILGLIVLVGLIKDLFRRDTISLGNGAFIWRDFAHVAILFGVAFVVSLPFTFSILFRYHLHILNPAPSNWIFPLLAVENLKLFMQSNFNWFAAAAIVGLVALIRNRNWNSVRTLLLTWLVFCVLELALNFIQQSYSSKLHLMFETSCSSLSVLFQGGCRCSIWNRSGCGLPLRRESSWPEIQRLWRRRKFQAGNSTDSIRCRCRDFSDFGAARLRNPL